MKKVLLFLLFPLFSFSQDRGCNYVVERTLSYSINDSSSQKNIYYVESGSINYNKIDTSEIIINATDSLTFYFHFSQSSLFFGPPVVDAYPSPGTGLTLISNDSIHGGGGVCVDWLTTNAVFSAIKKSTSIYLNHKEGGVFLNFKLNWIEDSGDRNINIKLSSSSSLNIATKKGNQILRMFSMNGQLVYSYSFDAAEFAGVNISLPENIFPSGIYVLSLVSATEAQNFKVFVR